MTGLISHSSRMNGPGHQPAEVLVQRLFARISEVSTLPALAIRIVDVANDAKAEAADLLEVVQIDAALATRIVRTVNSSYYGLQNKVADLKLAITLLGFKEIRNLAMTAYIAQLFKQPAQHGRYSREGLWNHLIGVGAAARLVAETSKKVAPREAYLGGLLHDLGFILTDQYLHKPFCKLLDSLSADTPVCELEDEVLGFTHAELGAYVTEKWHLPEQLTAPIRYHHAPEQYEGPHRGMVYAVALANFFCHLKELSSLGVPQTQKPPAEWFNALGLEKTHLTEIWERLDQVIESADIMKMVHAA
jgi:HD-like signal output (HDOD) protein